MGGGFVEDIPTPTTSEFHRICEAVEAYVADCKSRGATLIIDFEGEMPGYGGELISAAFLETFSVNGSTLKMTQPINSATPPPGLLLDLRSNRSAAFLRHVMENASITKLGWGSEADI